MKPKKCKVCLITFEPKQFGQVACGFPCAIIHAKNLKAQKEQREWRVEKKIIKEKLKTLSEYVKDLQIEINTIVRLIDKGHPCIATGSYNGKVNAGHYIGTLANPTIRFHLENIWLQSEHSNTWKSGDTIRYQTGIINLFGKEYLDYMNSLQSIKPIKLTIEELKEKISISRGIIKWLKLQERKFTIDERVKLRNKFNKEIGIYK